MSGPISDKQNALHALCTKHRAALLLSDRCGCFHCLQMFDPKEVDDWVDNGTTARCPKCGMDSVIYSTPEYTVTGELLAEMRVVWFGDYPTQTDPYESPMRDKLREILDEGEKNPPN